MAGDWYGVILEEILMGFETGCLDPLLQELNELFIRIDEVYPRIWETLSLLGLKNSVGLPMK